MGRGDGSPCPPCPPCPPSPEPTESPLAWRTLLNKPRAGLRQRLANNQPSRKGDSRLGKEPQGHPRPPLTPAQASTAAHVCTRTMNTSHNECPSDYCFCTPSPDGLPPSSFLGCLPCSSWTEFSRVENTDFKQHVPHPTPWPPGNGEVETLGCNGTDTFINL